MTIILLFIFKTNFFFQFLFIYLFYFFFTLNCLQSFSLLQRKFIKIQEGNSRREVD